MGAEKENAKKQKFTTAEQTFINFYIAYKTLDKVKLKDIWDNLSPNQQRRITAGISEYQNNHDNTEELVEFISRLKSVAA